MPSDAPVAQLLEKHWEYSSFTVWAHDSTQDTDPDPEREAVYDSYVTMEQSDGSAGANNDYHAIFSWYRDPEFSVPFPPDQIQMDQAVCDPDKPAWWKITDNLYEQLGTDPKPTGFQPTPAGMAALGYFTDDHADVSWHAPDCPKPPHPQVFMIPPPIPDNKVAEHCFETGYLDEYHPEATYYERPPLVSLTFDFDLDDLPSNAVNIRWEIVVNGINCHSNPFLLGGYTDYVSTQLGAVQTMTFKAASDTYRNNRVGVNINAADRGKEPLGSGFVWDWYGGEYTVGTITAQRTWDLTGGGGGSAEIVVRAIPNPGYAGSPISFKADVTMPGIS